MATFMKDKVEKRSRSNNPKSVHIDFSPSMFLRCHSRINDPGDKRTGVWHCAFEPASHKDNDNSIFATCGGNSVCIVDAKSAIVKSKHYSKDCDEEFTAMAWTTLQTPNGPINILAAAGRKSVLHLLHPDNRVCFSEHRVKKNCKVKRNAKNDIESLTFHPDQPNILFGAFKSGEIHAWDIGTPHPPEYKSNLELLQTMDTFCSAYSLTFSSHCNMLLCATERGAVGFLTPASALRKMQLIKQYLFSFPASKNENSPPDFVDSIEAVGDGKMIATKCALQGCIYIWDLEKELEKKSNSIISVHPVHILKWSDTDNYYMNIGINARANILACGDDRGTLWVYNIDEILSLPSQEHGCNNAIEWPIVDDESNLLTKRKALIPYENSDIVVNKVALSYDANFLVAVTNTNTVCIWKRDH